MSSDTDMSLALVANLLRQYMRDEGATEDQIEARLHSLLWSPLAAVRHEHGERIAEAQEALADREALTPERASTYRYAARLARDLSPPP